MPLAQAARGYLSAGDLHGHGRARAIHPSPSISDGGSICDLTRSYRPILIRPWPDYKKKGKDGITPSSAIPSRTSPAARNCACRCTVPRSSACAWLSHPGVFAVRSAGVLDQHSHLVEPLPQVFDAEGLILVSRTSGFPCWSCGMAMGSSPAPQRIICSNAGSAILRIGYEAAALLHRIMSGRNPRRTSMVIDLVSGTALSLKEIAGKAGFRSVQHMTTVFRQAFGDPPAKYRRAIIRPQRL